MIAIKILIMLILSIASSYLYANTIKFMPMGDSITRGGGHPIGSINSPTYRYYLSNLLSEKGWDVDYVGPFNGVGKNFTLNQDNNHSYKVPSEYQDKKYPNFTDQDLAANTGWKIDHFLKGKNSADKLVKQYKPEIVLIHLGTNDLGTRRNSPKEAANDISTLIDLIRKGNSGTKIFIAQIIPLMDNAYGKGLGEFELVKKYNHELTKIVAQQNTKTDFLPITLVDMWGRFNHRTMLAEKTHPNAKGDKKMALTWYQAITTMGMSKSDLIFWNEFSQVSAIDEITKNKNNRKKSANLSKKKLNKIYNISERSTTHALLGKNNSFSPKEIKRNFTELEKNIFKYSWYEGTTHNNGASKKYANIEASLKWKNFMGDWCDADDIEQGNKAFSQLNKSKGTKNYIELDVTSLVKKWNSNSNLDWTIVLRVIKGKGFYDINSREVKGKHKNKIIVQTLNDEEILLPIADTSLSPKTGRSSGSKNKITISKSTTSYIRFAKKSLHKIKQAKLYLALKKSSSRDFTIGVFASCPINIPDKIEYGLAAKYPLDKGMGWGITSTFFDIFGKSFNKFD